MNWYKTSQDTFDFYESMPETKPKPIEESSEYKSLEDRSQIAFQELLNGIHDRIELIRILKMYNIKWTQNSYGIIMALGSNSYGIDDFENPILKKVGINELV